MKKLMVLSSTILSTAAFSAYVDIAPAEFRSYKVNEKISFRVAAYESEGKLLKSGTFSLKVTEAGSRRIMKDLPVDLSQKNDFTFEVALSRPGFIFVSASPLKLAGGKTLKWESKPYAPYGGAAIEPEKIQPSVPRPADFDKFWANGVEEFKQAEVIVTPMPKARRKGYDVSRVEVKFPGGRGSIDGFMSIPQDRSRKYPAQIGVPGAGAGVTTVTPYYRGNQPAIEIWMNVHKFPTASHPATQKKRFDEYNESLPEKKYCYANVHDRDKYFFRDVWLALNRMVDYAAELKEFDGRNFASIGSSQGGGTAVAVAYLNKKISCLIVNVPAFCDHSGWKARRTCGWPNVHVAMKGKGDEVMPYFDAVNFASAITIPAWVSVGYVDTTCPPSGVYAMYNQLKGRKTMCDLYRLGHVVPTDFSKNIRKFYQAEFGGKK
ncbi:MAG: acetylxylan esterase [Lentisphaeria bacterium]|nr:acetylxylan esterase [Lentisphaeria bacterium]